MTTTPSAALDRPNSALRYKGYIPGLDVLRGLAILMVLVYHGTVGRVPWYTAFGPWRPWLLAAIFGSSGVQLFFVLSGFLITGILLDTRDSHEYYRKFYIRRALRILPAYLLLLVVLRTLHLVDWKFVLAAVLYIANMARLVGSHGAEYASLWSLAVEEQFYLLWPWIVRRFSLRTLTRIIAGYMVFDLLLRAVSLLVFDSTAMIYKLWGNAQMLLWGALFAILLRRGLLHAGNITRWLVILSVAAIPAWASDIAIYNGLLKSPAFMIFHQWPFQFTYGALLLLVIKYNTDPLPRAFRSVPARVLIFFGYISYGLYLVHSLIFTLFDPRVRGTFLYPSPSHPWGLLLNALIVTIISTLLAFLSRRYFEEPFLRRKDKVVPYREPAVNERPPAGAVPDPAQPEAATALPETTA